MPLSPAASSLADNPSTMKLLEKLRWLPTEMPCPGTADVSANSCVLPMLVGDTPGTSRARSRKLRPFIGSASTSACDTVPAIWLRAASSTDASPVDRHASCPGRRPRAHRHLEGGTDRKRDQASEHLETGQTHLKTVAARL